jgi:butyryl-CoA dehydrogenase
MELDAQRGGVSATTVHPGGIKTNIARNMRGDRAAVENFDRIALTTPEKAAREILAAVRANRRRALIGPDAKVIDFLARLPGSLLHRLIAFGYRRRH